MVIPKLNYFDFFCFDFTVPELPRPQLVSPQLMLSASGLTTTLAVIILDTALKRIQK